MNTSHSLRLRLPTDRPFTELKDEQTALVNPDSHELHNAEDEVRAHEERICNGSQCQPISDLAQIIRLVHTSMISRLGIRTLFFLDGQQIDSLKGSLIFLNDHLPIQCNWQSNDNLVTNVLVSYAAHRFQLLQDEGQSNAMLSNDHVLAEVSEKVKNWLQQSHLNLFNVLQNIRDLHENLARAREQLNSYATQMSCTLLPIELRPEDLLCLFAPEHTAIIHRIATKIDQLEQKCLAGIDQVEPITFAIANRSSKATAHGLPTFVYLDRCSTQIPLFDENKHLHNIVDGIRK